MRSTEVGWSRIRKQFRFTRYHQLELRTDPAGLGWFAQEDLGVSAMCSSSFPLSVSFLYQGYHSSSQ